MIDNTPFKKLKLKKQRHLIRFYKIEFKPVKVSGCPVNVLLKFKRYCENR
jgi:hypothetical protein